MVNINSSFFKFQKDNLVEDGNGYSPNIDGPVVSARPPPLCKYANKPHSKKYLIIELSKIIYTLLCADISIDRAVTSPSPPLYVCNQIKSMLVPAFEMGSDRNTGAPLYRCFQGQSADKKDPS